MIVNPRSKWKIRWDILVSFLILYSVVVIPIRAGFNTVAKTWVFPLEISMDIVFGLDILLSFRTTIWDDHIEVHFYLFSFT